MLVLALVTTTRLLGFTFKPPSESQNWLSKWNKYFENSSRV